MPEEYKTATIDHIDIIEPGSFGLDKKEETARRTIFLRCKSDDLAPLEFKPHFPTSEFHITIYDGKSKKFADELLRTLRKFKWAFRVPLPPGTTLTTIPLKVQTFRRPQASRDYKPNLQQLFYSATSEQLNWERLINLTDKQRLKLVIDICTHLRASTLNLRE